MAEYLFLMHAGATGREEDWGPYLGGLQTRGVFHGGSEIGAGACFSKVGEGPAITGHLSGYIKVEAESLEAAQTLLAGNPTYEAGGVVEIRELPVAG